MLWDVLGAQEKPANIVAPSDFSLHSAYKILNTIPKRRKESYSHKGYYMKLHTTPLYSLASELNAQSPNPRRGSKGRAGQGFTLMLCPALLGHFSVWDVHEGSLKSEVLYYGLRFGSWSQRLRPA